MRPRRLVDVTRVLAAVCVVACGAESAAAQSSTDSRWDDSTSGGQAAASQIINDNRAVIWTDCRPPRQSVTYGELADQVAPVLWFSPDEPGLPRDPDRVDAPLRSLKGAAIPGSIPELVALSTPNGAPPPTQAKPAVYYRVRLVRVKAGADRTSFNFKPGVGEQPVALDLVTSIYVRFFFYYPEDVGFGSHQHDLESVEMTLDVDTLPSGCHEVTLFRVSGAAHGVGWYTNTLNIYQTAGDPLLLPPVVLVEEGKHATVPDRNGDGVYSPGYDVNVNPNEAWGIRDGLRNNRQAGSAYHAEGAKPRERVHRLFPPRFRGFRDSREYEAVKGADVATYHYELKEGGVEGANCDGEGSVRALVKAGRTPLPRTTWDDVERLHEFLVKTRFCAATDVRGENTHSRESGKTVTWLAAPYGSGVVSWNERFSWGYSFVAGQGEAGAQGVSVAGGFGLGLAGLTGGWLVPRYSAHRVAGAWSHSVDALYAPSVSRIVDWYLAVGADVARNQSAAGGRKTQIVEEFGFKLRVGVEPLIKRGLGFMNFRLGYRGALQGGLTQGRWVIEMGFGGGF